MFYGMVSSEALEDPLVLNTVTPLKVIIDQKDDADAPLWHRYLLKVSDKELKDILNKLKPQVKQGWYAIFWNDLEVHVIFTNKVFSLKREQQWKSKAYEQVRAYGTTHGVQDYYIDFNERFLHYDALVQEFDIGYKPHHVAYTVNNLDESITWYKDKLGFSLVNRFNRPVRSTALLKRDGVQIELFGISEGLQPLPEHNKDLLEDLSHMGIKHLCIEVNDLTETVEELKSKGVVFVTEPDEASFGGHYIFFKDCNGILIELYCTK